MRPWLQRLKDWARLIRRDAVALYLAARDPRVSWYAKALAVLIAAYAFSPIDLIPDFIPVLGYLDELILLPLAIAGGALAFFFGRRRRPAGAGPD